MRVLTVRQPWAWAIIHGGKTIENRSRNVAGKYRGPVAIHVAKTRADVWIDSLTPDTALDRAVRDWWNSGGPAKRFTDDEGDVLVPWWADIGHIIGVVDLIDVHMECRYLEPTSRQCSPWAESNAYHLEFANPRAIMPIPTKGRLGLWRPDSELEARIREATR